jgi:tetratricopeptide (TPR) repeat protein
MRKRTIALAALAALALLACSNSKTLERLFTLEGRIESKGMDPVTVEDLKAGIAKYEKEAQRTVEASGHIGTYYKLLALKYLDTLSYGEALKAAEKALEYSPTNAKLFYIVGLCSAYMAKAEVGIPGGKAGPSKAEYYRASEAAYLRSLELNPRDANALLGLAVLYAFELDRVKEAEPYLESLLQIESENVDALFVLARVYVLTDRYEDAANAYDKIILVTKIKERKAEAERNKAEVLKLLYGGSSEK